ncbi:EF-hand calcium-binding domain-containing protein 6 isoform X3 [Ascaphus truei]|uniref:EF-hand calcium-binding domain-containing protein 6 isoform X3 n=1 Tax=Ascaphus truei TaxID=8439 RepID=UPI003F5A3BA4
MHSRTRHPGSFRELRPHSQGIIIAGRPQSSPGRALSRNSHSSSVKSSQSSSVMSAPDPSLSLLDIEQICYQRINEIEEDLKNAFLTCDADQNFTVTKGELYRVLQHFIVPLTQSQFDALLTKIPVNGNGTIPYLQFLAKYHRASTSASQVSAVKRRQSSGQMNRALTLNELEFQLKHTISKNMKNIVRSCRLFDYNQNGQIQKHELRRILENHCFRMKDVEYEKIWNRYRVGKNNTLDYKDLLRNLGVNVELQNRPVEESAEQALNWEAVQLEQQKRKSWRPPSSTKRFTSEDCTIDELETAFRKKMCTAYPNLVKAFRAFDIAQVGYVTVDALKSVINNFIFPLSNGTFHELMSRFRVTVTDKIPWEQLLKQFHDPVMIENGQTKPTRSNHRVNPAKGASKEFSSDHILHKLHRHIQEAYPSLKQAFLVLDDGSNGSISRKELRRIVDCMMFRMTDEQFKELMIILDPEHTGFITYHQFLSLFEERESATDHKWLNNTRLATKGTPVLLAWDTMKDILCEKITSNSKDFYKSVQSFDREGTGIINKDHFKEMLLTYCPSLSEDHFHIICEQYNEVSSNGVAYMEFLRDLGVPISHTGDFNGVSSDIIEGSQFGEELRQTYQSGRMRETENPASYLVRKIPAEEVMDKLKDCMAKHECTRKDGVLACNTLPNGKSLKKDVQKVLGDHELHLDEDQLNVLTEKLECTKEGLSYMDLVSLFEVPQEDRPGVTLQDTSNHRVHNTKFHYMTAEECLSQFMDKLREGYGEAYTAFYKIDSNRDGIVTMHDFRSLLESFMFIITQKEYERLLHILGLHLSSTLNYMEFLHLLQKQEKDECPPWLNSLYRPKETLECADLACEQAHYYLVTKARGRWHDLAKTFCEIDRQGNGIVQSKDLRNVLFRFSLPITPKEFEKLWKRYDPEGKGYLTHQEFLQKLGVNLASGDCGPSRRIVEDDHTCIPKHYSKQQKTQEEMHEFQKHQTNALDIKAIEQQIKDKFRDYYQEFSAAFAKMDTNKDGFITVHDFQSMLRGFHFYLDDHQFLNLLYRLRIKAYDSKISYFDFLKAVDDGRASTYGQRQEQIVSSENFQTLSPQKALDKLKDMVTSSYDVLCKAFIAFDKDVTGTIKPFQLHQIIDSFCFKLTDKQFRYLLSKLTLNEDHTIDWKAFLHGFSVFSTEFENLWHILPLNSYGNLKYHEFLKRFSCEMPATPLRMLLASDTEKYPKPSSPVKHDLTSSRSPSRIRRPKTAPSVLNKSNTDIRRPRTAAAHSSPLINCEQIENKLRNNLQKTWQEIHKACREKDPERVGEITASDFLGVMERFNMDMAEEELDQLTIKYAIRNRGKFSYPDFFRNVMLGPKPHEHAPLQRMKVQKPQIPMSTGVHGPLFLDAMLRMQPQIHNSWKPMRRTFQSCDNARTGYINVQDFRQILRKYGINLSEEEFFHILGFFDKDLKSTISYNDFLSALLR